MTWFDTAYSLPLETGFHDLFNRSLLSYTQIEITTSSGVLEDHRPGLPYSYFGLTLCGWSADREGGKKEGERKRKEGTAYVLFVKNHQFVYFWFLSFAMLHFYKNILN